MASLQILHFVEDGQDAPAMPGRDREVGMQLKGADIVIESLKFHGVDLVFGYPGGTIMPVYDALYRSGFRHILARHEQGAAHAADGYARATGRTGVVLATSGPGATNLVTGLMTAYMDSVPLIAITGQVATSAIGTDAFQEADIYGITIPITKYNYLVKDVSKLAETFAEAFYIARSGRPGPVLIDIPKDVQLALAEYAPVAEADIPLLKYSPKPVYEYEAELDELVAMISRAERPVLYVGGGAIISEASEAVGRLARMAHIPVGHNPRGVVLTRDGRRLLVANRLEDTISVIDTRTDRVASTISLAGPKTVSVLRHGEQTFYTARQSFQGQIGCATCHIDSTFDGLTWDLEPDGFGRDIVDNKLLEGVKDTAPYKWNGGNPNIPTECGPRTEKYFWRSENYDNETLVDLSTFVRSLPPRPNRWRQPDGELTPAQERGNAIFTRSQDKFGNPIPETNRCVYCHSGPKGTNQKLFDVGTRKATDNGNLLKSAPLTNVALTAPYLHDGSARTMEEIWTVYNPEDRHGRTNDLTKDELNDLIEYLRTR